MSDFYNDINFNKYLDKLIGNLFKKLNKKEKDYLNKFTLLLLNFIKIKFNIEFNNFKYQLKMNNNRDLISIISLFLPYVNDTNNYEIFRQITSLNDLIKKKNNLNTYNNLNIHKNLYKYTPYIIDISNVQNDRYIEYSLDNTFIKFIINLFFLLIFSIDRIYYKLCVNWINIFPISVISYKESNLYKNTFYFNYETNKFDTILKEQLNWTNSDNITNFIYSGLPINEVYNVFVNFYYNSVKDIKFLILDINKNEENIPFINALDKIFKNLLVSNFKKKLNWESIDETDRIKILDIWIYLLNSLEEKTIIDTLINSFESNYENLHNIKNYIKFSDNNYDIYIKNFEKKNVNNNLFSHIYLFLIKSFHKLKVTPYYFYIYDNLNNSSILNDIEKHFQINQKINNNDFLNYLNEKVLKDKITNIPESCKISCNDYFKFSEKIYKQFNSLEWDNLNDDNKNKFLEFLESYNIIDNNIIKDINDLIKFNYIRINIFDITFKVLLRLGLLTEFKVNKELTDEINYLTEKDLNIKNKKIKLKLKNQFNNYDFNNDDIKLHEKSGLSFKQLYQDNYYFVNNEKYKFIKMDKFKKNNSKEHLDYFDILVDGEKQSEINRILWFTTFTFNWIMQIIFFIKFINKRVILVTGGTGQGKSTFFPILIYYASKAFDYNLKAKTVITQPRITPVEKNSYYVSQQICYPITDKNINYKDEVDTNNSFIQYAHSGHEHINKLDEYFLRLTTDGKVLNELTDNILLKKKKIINKKFNKFEFLEENIFDIIGVDESHEHNTNMDLILSLMKLSMLYNTSLRLFIISATLEEDEAIYRRFYKNIDDNLKYPLNLTNYNNFINRNLLDRRIHISPPGQQNRFKIYEFYENIEPENYEIATTVGINKVLEILNTSQNGEILFFTFSIKECIRICKEINKMSNFKQVAIPFYSNMNKKYKKYIEDLKENKVNIKHSKNKIVDICSNSIEEPTYDNNNSYDRIIIVATNAAEASITIDNLKYVVDIGYQITVRYDSLDQISTPDIHKISESSRIQRRGRVGRSSSGTVYYIYKLNSRKDIVSEYNIVNSELTSSVLNLLNDNYLELPLFYNINFYKNYDLLHEKKKNNLLDNYLKKYEFLPEFNIFKKQFFYNNDELYDKNLVNNIFKLNNNNNYNDKIPLIYNSGLSLFNVLDNNGIFYIIHPNENELIRDIRLGKFKDVNKLKEINKINNFIENLKNYSLLVDLDFNHRNKNIYKLAKTNINKIITKISQYFGIFEYNIDYTCILIYGIKYDCYNEILIIIAGILSCGGQSSKISNLFKIDKNNTYSNKFSNKFADIFLYLDIYNNFINYFQLNIDVENFNKVNEYKKNVDIFNSSKNNIVNQKLTLNEFNLLMRQVRELTLNNSKNIDSFSYKKISNNLESIKKSVRFNDWCEYYSLNDNVVISFIENYIKLKSNYNDMEISEKELNFNLYDLLDEIYVSKSSNLQDNILKCFISVYKHNLVEYKGNNNYLKLINNHVYQNILVNKLNDTFIKPSKYLIYINSHKDNFISLMINIYNPKIIFEIGFNIYNLKTYIKSDSNFINYYDTKSLNNNMRFIKINENKNINFLLKNIEDDSLINFFKNKKLNLLYEIDKIRNKYKLNTFDENTYNILTSLIHLTNFYYYFIKKIVD